jgi:hypothetical protein
MADKITVSTGTVTLGGSLDLSLLGTFGSSVGNVGDTFTLILDGGSNAVSGVFSNVTPITPTTGSLTLGGGLEFTINYAANLDAGAIGNDVTATLTAVPEPGTCAVLLLGATMLVGRRRQRAR